MKRLGFLARFVGAATIIATPTIGLMQRILPLSEKPFATIEAEYPEFGPAAGNVTLWMRLGKVPEMAYSREALGISSAEVRSSVDEMLQHGAAKGWNTMVLSSVDNLLADLKGLGK
jgi:hypothetical protein